MKSKLSSKILGINLLGAAFALAVVFGTSDAAAGERCTTKPAVCARLKAQPQKEVRPLVRKEPTKRCTTKPAVCNRQMALKDVIKVRSLSPATDAVTKRCTSKPAVCARLGRR